MMTKRELNKLFRKELKHYKDFSKTWFKKRAFLNDGSNKEDVIYQVKSDYEYFSECERTRECYANMSADAAWLGHTF